MEKHVKTVNLSGIESAMTRDNTVPSDQKMCPLLVEGVTDAEGKYRIEWTMKKVDFLDDTAELYVKFEGDDEHRSCHTKQSVIEVEE